MSRSTSRSFICRSGIVTACVLAAAGWSVNRAEAGSTGNGHQNQPPVAVSTVPPVAQALDSGALHVQADPVAAALEDQNPQRIVISPDGTHIAYVSTRGSRFVVVIDGKPTEKYDEIGHTNNAVNKEIIFSNDGQHVMFIGRRGPDEMVVVDGKEIAGYMMVNPFIFSPDGKQYAFIAQRDSNYYAVVNGKESPGYSPVQDLQFSSNNKHVAYTGRGRENKVAETAVSIDGKPETLFATVRDFAFSADGDHWAYIGDDQGNVDPSTPGQKSHLMVDGKEVVACEKIYSCHISADGHVMYTASKGSNTPPHQEIQFDQCVGLDGTEWNLAKGYQFLYSTSGTPQDAILSPDGKHAAWVERISLGANTAQYVSVDGKRGLGYKNIRNFTFTPDSQHIVYVADQSDNGVYVVKDGDEAGPYKTAPNGHGFPFKLCFSPDGKHMAYQAGDGKTTFVIEDGKQQASYDMIVGPLVFSPESSHLAYIAMKDTMANLPPIQRQQAEQSPTFDHGKYVVLDGEQQQLVPKLVPCEFGPHFSPDGKHLAYSDNSRHLVIDGHEMKLPANAALQAIADDTIEFTADSKHALYRSGHFVIDGDTVAGYPPITYWTGGKYKPVMSPDGSIFFFGCKDGTEQMSAPLYRVTVGSGPARDFGSGGNAGTVVANTPAQPANNAQTNTTPAPQTTPQQPVANTPEDKNAKKAQDALKNIDKLRNIFGH